MKIVIIDIPDLLSDSSNINEDKKKDHENILNSVVNMLFRKCFQINVPLVVIRYETCVLINQLHKLKFSIHTQGQYKNR